MSEELTIEQVQAHIEKSIAEYRATPPDPTPPAPEPTAGTAYDPAQGEPTRAQYDSFSQDERALVKQRYSDYEEKFAEERTEDDLKRKWNEAQAVGDEERAAARAQAEWDAQVAADPQARFVAEAVAYGREAAQRWSGLSDSERVQAFNDSGLLGRQRNVVGADVADQIAQHAGLAQHSAQVAQLELRLVPCPRPDQWGSFAIVHVKGLDGKAEPHVLTPPGGFTPEQEIILGLREQRDPLKTGF